MSLLFDENLSWRLCQKLQDIFPGAVHVGALGLKQAGDDEIWRTARERSLVIVSKDDDFRQRAMLYGAPPKSIWVRLGNVSTDRIAEAIRTRKPEIDAFLSDAEAAVFVLSASSSG